MESEYRRVKINNNTIKYSFSYLYIIILNHGYDFIMNNKVRNKGKKYVHMEKCKINIMKYYDYKT